MSGLDWTVLTEETVVNGRMEPHLAALDRSVSCIQCLNHVFVAINTNTAVKHFLVTTSLSTEYAAKEWAYFSPDDSNKIVCEKGMSNSAYCDYDSPRSHNNNCSVSSNGSSVSSAASSQFEKWKTSQVHNKQTVNWFSPNEVKMQIEMCLLGMFLETLYRRCLSIVPTNCFARYDEVEQHLNIHISHLASLGELPL